MSYEGRRGTKGLPGNENLLTVEERAILHLTTALENALRGDGTYPIDKAEFDVLFDIERIKIWRVKRGPRA